MIEPISDPTVLEGYLTDASNLRGHADALLRPRTTAEVAEIVRHCQRLAIPLTITAARTSTTGSCRPSCSPTSGPSPTTRRPQARV